MILSFQTNISCHPVGPFGGLMAVSMRPVSRDMLDVVFKTTLPLPDMHGAPVHIGNPGELVYIRFPVSTLTSLHP